MNSKHTYFEKSVKQYFDNWKFEITPLQNLEAYKKRLEKTKQIKQQEARKKFLDNRPIVMDAPVKKKRGRPKKKKANTN